MKKKIGMFFLGMFFVASANAQQTYQELEQITVNEQVTTVVTASEPIHFVDVSTDKVAGDKPIDNTEDMTRFARRVWNSPAKIHNIKSRKHRVEMRLNNVYAVGEYFFIDFSVENKTNIRFDIDELRVKLSDKKVQKATNNQTIELTPSLVLDKCKSFLHGYRNVIVIKKMTFPNDKVVVIELSEKQISGRTISISIDYEDVLSADAFDKVLLQEE